MGDKAFFINTWKPQTSEASVQWLTNKTLLMLLFSFNPMKIYDTYPSHAAHHLF